MILRDRPIYVHYGVTTRCNLKCRSCVIWNRDSEAEELSVVEVHELARVLSDLGTVQVSLGGGEPAMRKDLPDMARAFLDHDIRVRVLSNGVAMTPGLARRLVDAGVRDFSFSVDSLRPDVQEHMDAARGTFDKRMDNLMSLADIVPSRDSVPLINTVITPRNYDEVPRIIDLAEALGFFTSVIPVHLAGIDAPDEHRFYSADGTLRFAHEHHEPLRAVYRQIRSRKRKGGRIINSSAFLEGSVRYLTTGSAQWPCRAGELFLSVAPDGQVSACHAFEGRHGVHFRDLPEQLARPGYVDEVRELVAGCEGCYRPCWAEVGFMVLDPMSTLEMVRNQLIARRERGAPDLARARELLAQAAGEQEARP